MKKTFRIYVDGELFYHPNLSKLKITEAKLNEDAESVDSFNLTVPSDHPYINSIIPLSSSVVCKEGDLIVFEGRAIDDGFDFYKNHSWTLEGALSYLNDSLLSPFEYKGTLSGLVQYFIDEHNKKVEDKKKFVMGRVTVKDDNDYISYSSSDYLSTFTTFKEKLINTHGGYLYVRYEDGKRYLDYLADYTSVSTQRIEYGKNLLNVKVSGSHTERFSALIPLGANIEVVEGEEQKRVNIESVNDGKNYIYDEKTVEEIGWLWKTETWDDVTLPSNLLKKAKARLQELIKGTTSMELTIVDESEADSSIMPIHTRQYVYCYSPAHGIDGRYLVKTRVRDYLNPANNTITIGASGISLTAATNKQHGAIEALESDIFGATEKIENLNEEIDSINKNKMYRVEIRTTGSSIFRNKQESSTLSCYVYSWDKDITDTLPSSIFNWKRVSDGSDETWNSKHKGMKQITITTEDVNNNASFFCEVNIEEGE